MQDFEMSPPLQPSAADSAEHEYPEVEDETEEEQAEAPPARSSRSREGLPPAYRMRHAPHYVEQLMGDTPLQTVRHISVDQIDSAETGTMADDLEELAASIRQVGVLQPLLVTQGSGGRFDLLAGEKRLAAAQLAGLQAVPCLLVHADEARASELRAQAAVVARRESEPLEQAPAAVPEAAPGHTVTDAAPGAFDTGLTAAVDEIGGALDFVAALIPAASSARSPFQQAVISDVIKVEKRRAAALTIAASSLTDTTALEPEEFDWLDFTADLRTDIALEARLRDVEVEWLHSLKLRTAVADKRAVMTAWRAVLHATLGLCVAGDRIAITLATPRVRPAVLLTVLLQTQARFTPQLEDQGTKAGPFAGGPGELMLASARHSARRQGGRLSVSTTEESLKIEFVVPQPLAYWQ